MSGNAAPPALPPQAVPLRPSACRFAQRGNRGQSDDGRLTPSSRPSVTSARCQMSSPVGAAGTGRPRAADVLRTDKADGRRSTVMRVLVVGASGAIGTRLVPQLRRCGHEVIGSCHSPGKAGKVRALGAEPITLDALDATAVREAVAIARPDAIICQATALADAGFSRNLDRSFAQTNRLRTEGTDILLAAAREAGGPP